MASGKTVTLTIKVKDSELDATTRKLDKLGVSAKKTQTATGASGLGGGASNLAAGFGKVNAIAGPVAIAIGVVGTAAIAAVGAISFVSREIYNLAKGYSDYVSQIGDASEQTGISTVALSALGFEARKTGQDFKTITGGIEFFIQKIAKAEKGSKSARADLRLLGIDGKKAADDIEGAYAQVLKTIAKLPPGVQQAAAANDAFGRSSAEMISFINGFDGDLERLTQTASQYGAIVGGEDVAASNEFKTALDEIGMAAESVKLEFGKELLPTVTSVLKNINGWMKENRGQIKLWASAFGDAIAGIVSYIKKAEPYFNALMGVNRVITGIVTGGGSELAMLGGEKLGRGVLAEGAAIRANRQSQAQTEEEFVGPGEYGRRSAQNKTYSYLPRGSADSAAKNALGSKESTHKPSSRARAVMKAASDLGVSALDLASIISFETAGTFDPWKKGPTTKWGQHRGLIQFGEPQAKHNKAYKGQSFENQVTTSVVKYLKETFAKAGTTTQGASLVQLYAAVLGGNPKKQNTADKFGTTARNAIGRLKGEHRQNAINKIFGGSAGNITDNGAGGFDLAKSAEFVSGFLTKQSREKQILEAIKQHKEAGLIPSEQLINEFHAMAVEEAQKAGVIQPRKFDIIKQFRGAPEEANLQTLTDIKQAFPELAGMMMGAEIGNANAQGLYGAEAQEEAKYQWTKKINLLEHDYLEAQKDGLNIGQRRLDLLFSQHHHEELIAGLAEDAKVAQLEDADALGKQLELRLQIYSDPNFRTNAKDNEILSERNSLLDEIFGLETQIAALGYSNSEKYRVAILGATLQLGQLNEELARNLELFADPEYRETAQATAAAQARLGITQEIFDLENQLANQGITAAERYRAAWLGAIYDVREADITAVEDQIRAEVQLADSREIHIEQVRAEVLGHLASQKTMTETVAGEIIDLYDSIADAADKFLDKSIGKIPILGGIAKTVTRNALTDITKNLLDTFLPSGISEQFTKTSNPVAKPIVEKISKSNELLGNIDRNIASAFGGTSSASLTPQGIIQSLTGFLGGKASGSSASTASSGGGGLGGLSGLFGSIFGGVKGLFGGGGGSSSTGSFGGTPPFVQPSFAAPSVTQSTAIAQIAPLAQSITTNLNRESSPPPVPITNSIPNATVTISNQATGAATQAAAGKFSLAGLQKSFAGLAPMLGLGLGGALGGGGGLGGILGSAGGLAGGLLGSALLSGSLTGATTGGIFAGSGLLGLSALGGITLAAAPLLLIGGWLLGRNKKRRMEETARNSAILDAFSQVEELVKQVDRDKLDGQSAIAQASGIRGNYVEQMNQLKDKKTKRHALKDVSRIDSKIDLLKEAADRQEKRQEIGQQIYGEFNRGGVVRGFAGGGVPASGDYSGILPKNFSGVIPGVFDRKDDLLMAVSRGETAIVMTPEQWSTAGASITPALKRAKVPGFNRGGTNAPILPAGNFGRSKSQEVNVEIGDIHLDAQIEVDADGMVTKSLATVKNKNLIGKILKAKILDG